MTQYEQENDLGRGGGEVDEETVEAAWSTADDLRSSSAIDPDDESLGGVALGLDDDEARRERAMDDEDAGMGGV